MKLKYYLRGLGTGIAVTALMIGISSIASSQKTMSDEEVIVRAKELGMVERTVLADTVEATEEATEDATVEETEESEEESEPEGQTPSGNDEAEIVEPENPEPEIQEEPEPAEPETELPFGMPDEAGTVFMNISRGDSSVSVSRRLEELGLIDSSEDFDRYLCRNGYDKRIQTGNYEIPVNATQEEIALLITSR